jgi:hypothetical protein
MAQPIAIFVLQGGYARHTRADYSSIAIRFVSENIY